MLEITKIKINKKVSQFQRKCDLYWPVAPNAPQTYGLIEVTLTDEDVQATHTIRTFKVRHIKIRRGGGIGGKSGSKSEAAAAAAGERVVLQYHYTNWPDHGVPDNPLPVLAFVKKSSAAVSVASSSSSSSNRDGDGGPIVVHCR